MKICLMGYMGSGKTSVGARLSTRFDYLHIDTDMMISDQMGDSIPQIFEKYGESHFRSLEKKVLRSIDRNDSVVVSTGGGMPCTQDNINYINEHYKSVYLHLNVNKLISRLSENEKEGRPLLNNISSNSELKDYIESKLLEREQYYFNSDLMVDASQSIDDVADDIWEYLHERK